jgi:hypothetical protein
MAIAEDDASQPPGITTASPARANFNVPASAKKLTPKRRKH